MQQTITAFKMMGVVMRYLCRLACKFWWEHWYSSLRGNRQLLYSCMLKCRQEYISTFTVHHRYKKLLTVEILAVLLLPLSRGCLLEMIDQETIYASYFSF